MCSYTTNLVKSLSIHKRAITNRLWRYRKERQFSQRHIARLLGHRTTARVSRWESGAKIPTLDNALLVPVGNLIGVTFSILQSAVKEPGLGRCPAASVQDRYARPPAGKFDCPPARDIEVARVLDRGSGRSTAIRPRADSGGGARRPAGSRLHARAPAVAPRGAGAHCGPAPDGVAPCCSRRRRRAGVGGGGPRSE